MNSLRYIIFLFLLVACSKSENKTTEYSFSITEENGVTVAETRNGPKYSHPIFTVEEVVRVKEDESVEGSLLTRPLWMGIDEDGMIYVLDGIALFHETRLVVYNQNGSYSHVIGREGRGPGEYLAPKLISTSKGTVTLFERSLRRISWFSRDGSFIRLLSCAPGKALPDMAYIDSDENQILINATRTDNWISQMAVVYSSDEELLGTIESPRVRRYDSMVMGNGKWATPSHFNGRAIFNYSPIHGLMYTDGNEAIVNWYNLSGELIKVYDLGMESGPVTDADIALADSYFRKLWLDGNPIGEDLYRAWVKKDKFPKSRAFWNGATVDEFGYLWLEDPSSSFHESERHYRVVNPNGEYLGDCFLPQGMGRISNGHYLLIDLHLDSEEQNLIVYQLVSTVEELKYP